jgi:CubicO group peptidase (beta-lactamase class C family)
LLKIDGAPDDTFAAIGHDDQYIYVVPSLDLVVVRNGLYVKDPGEPVADPNLFSKYPSDGLAPGRGTTPPEGSWKDADFLAPIIASIQE